MESSDRESDSVPHRSRRRLIIVGSLLALFGGAVALFWKPEPPPPDASPPEPPVVRAVVDAPPPPPPPPPAPEATTSASSASAGRAISNFTSKAETEPCSERDCEGNVTPALRGALEARRAGGRHCYQKALANNPGLSGKLNVRLRVARDGRVCNAELSADQLKDVTLSSCVLGLYRGVSLPRPQGGCVVIDVPLAFTTQNATL